MVKDLLGSSIFSLYTLNLSKSEFFICNFSTFHLHLSDLKCWPGPNICRLLSLTDYNQSDKKKNTHSSSSQFVKAQENANRLLVYYSGVCNVLVNCPMEWEDINATSEEWLNPTVSITYGGGVNCLHRKQMRKQRNFLLALQTLAEGQCSDWQSSHTPVAQPWCHSVTGNMFEDRWAGQVTREVHQHQTTMCEG